MTKNNKGEQSSMNEEDTRHNVADLFLKNLHEEAGAKFVVFANTNMPIFYPLGMVKEHLHTRSKAGVFDISHMKMLLLEGPEANEAINRCLPIAPASMIIGRCQYSFLLNDSGGIIDDLILTKLAENRYILTVNAANWQLDLQTILAEITEVKSVSVTALERVILAVQGPKAAEVMSDLGFEKATHLAFMSAYEPQKDWLITRSGYTGEDGFEIAIPHSEAKVFAIKLINHSETAWIGLAARDSLRLEAGLCLHGQDITEQINPVEAGLLWAVPKALREHGSFKGAAALRIVLQAKPKKQRCGFSVVGRQPVRAGAKIIDAGGEIIGEVTSGCFAPTVDAAIAMGYLSVANHVTSSETIYAQQRGKNIEIKVQKLPFVPHNYHK